MTHAPCVKCRGTGFDIDMEVEKIKPGVLLPMCGACRGAGSLNLHQFDDRFRAAWVVGAKYLVRMSIERRKGGFVELDIEWSPRLPKERGPGKLRPSERQDYERGRDDALRLHMAQMGGGDFSVVCASDRH
jgi:hypothetical protein